jgi:hypothetical protein
VSDCPLCLADEVCPGQHCLIEAIDVIDTIRSLKTGYDNDWNAALDRAIDAVINRFEPFGPVTTDRVGAK